MKASFVIVNFNRKDELLKTISKAKEVINGDSGYEIIVVDNASADGSADAVKSSFPDVNLIRKKENIGAPAWNEGFENAKGEYFIIVDDDSHIESGLTEALNYLDDNPNVGILALNVTTGPYTSKDWGWQDKQSIVGFIGCGAILRKETYKEIGGYADWIFLYVNEWEIGLRAVDAGYEVRFFENCLVTHRASKVNRSSKRLRVFVTRNEMAIVYKYFNQQRWKYLLRIAINSMKGLRQLQLKETWYNLIGIKEFLKMRKSLNHTPVSAKSQQLFLDNFASTKSAFSFVKRDVTKLFRMKIMNNKAS
jgi:GT2 family glycosyltransferase